MGKIDELVQTARFYIGYTEKKGNQGFTNAVFDKEMRTISGFYNGASWCGFFVMLCVFLNWRGSGAMLRLLKKYCSASTHQMWLNFKASKEFKTGIIPTVGALVFWQDGDSNLGHVGICSSVKGKIFTSVEGNTSANGSREGTCVAEHTHVAELTHHANGLNYIGCVYLDQLLVKI